MLTLRNIIWIFLLLFALVVISFSAHAQTPQQTLNQYISDLQNNPDDNALREKIIKHVQTMKPKPAIPAEAEKFEGRAEFAIKNAKTEADFLDAAKEYDKALLLAPWVSSYYFNQAIAYEKAGKPEEAKRGFEFYLLAAPNAKDARDVRKRIAGLEYSAEKAAKESSPEAIAAREGKKFEDLLRKIDGRRYSSAPGAPGRPYGVIDVKGRLLVIGVITPPGYSNLPAGYQERYNGATNFTGQVSRIAIQGYETHNTLSCQYWTMHETYIISEDGSTISARSQTTQYQKGVSDSNGEVIYYQER